MLPQKTNNTTEDADSYCQYQPKHTSTLGTPALITGHTLHDFQIGLEVHRDEAPSKPLALTTSMRTHLSITHPHPKPRLEHLDYLSAPIESPYLKHSDLAWQGKGVYLVARLANGNVRRKRSHMAHRKTKFEQASQP